MVRQYASHKPKAVTVANERSASVRNNRYMLTDAEAIELEKDERVEAVELDPIYVMIFQKELQHKLEILINHSNCR